jgi:hypothetical protein
MLNSVDAVIDALGGPTKTAAAVGLGFASAVANWRTRKEIPAEYFVLITDALVAAGKDPANRSVFGFKEVVEARA